MHARIARGGVIDITTDRGQRWASDQYLQELIEQSIYRQVGIEFRLAHVLIISVLAPARFDLLYLMTLLRKEVVYPVTDDVNCVHNGSLRSLVSI